MKKYEIAKNTGIKGMPVHTQKECAGQNCCIHNPSNHLMKDWPLNWRSDRGIMERLCSHGIGHPDPDSLAYISRTKGKEIAKAEAVHGCDDCCNLQPKPL